MRCRALQRAALNLTLERWRWPSQAAAERDSGPAPGRGREVARPAGRQAGPGRNNVKWRLAVSRK